MKTLVAAALLCAVAPHGHAANPSQKIIDACLSLGSTSKRVTYKTIHNTSVNDINEVDEDNKDLHKTSTVVDLGKDTFGVWQTASPKASGLVLNDEQINWRQVTRLYKRHQLPEINLYKSLYGIAREGAKSYLCITFTFDGLGDSGSYQNIRGLYLIDRTTRPFRAYYTAGDIRNIGK
jgi:hypothetical protein